MTYAFHDNTSLAIQFPDEFFKREIEGAYNDLFNRIEDHSSAFLLEILISTVFVHKNITPD